MWGCFTVSAIADLSVAIAVVATLRGSRMRPKFSVANLLLLTVIVALIAQLCRDRVQIGDLQSELAIHDSLRAQARLVRKWELELKEAEQNMVPEYQLASAYRLLGLGESNSEATRIAGGEASLSFEYTPVSIGSRRARARLSHARLQLLRHQALLEQMQRDVSEMARKRLRKD